MGSRPFKCTTKCKGYMINGAIMLFGRASRALSIYQMDGRVCCHGNMLTTGFATIGEYRLSLSSFVYLRPLTEDICTANEAVDNSENLQFGTLLSIFQYPTIVHTPK